MVRKIVRKQPLVHKLRSYPLDFFLYINEARLSIDWDKYASTFAFPMGILLTMVSLFLSKTIDYNNSVNSKSHNILFETAYHDYEYLKSRLKGTANSGARFDMQQGGHTGLKKSWTIMRMIDIFEYTLIVFSILHVFRLLNSYRVYTLLYTDKEYQSPSVQKKNLNTSTILDRFNAILSLLKYHLLSNQKGNDEYENNSDDDDNDHVENAMELNLVDGEVLQLKVWNLSKFSLNLSIAFNPLYLLIIRFCSSDLSMFKLFVIILSMTFTARIFMSRFLLLMQNKQILYEEMFSEFNSKFVKPKSDVLKKDVMIDSTRGALDSTILTDIRPFFSNKSKVFMTHDANGKLVRNNTGLCEDSRKDQDATDKTKTFPRSQTYRQSQREDSVDSNQPLSRNIDRTNLRYSRQLDFLQNLEDIEDDEVDAFDRVYTSSTPFRTDSNLKSPRKHSLSPKRRQYYQAPYEKTPQHRLSNHSKDQRLTAINTSVDFQSPGRHPTSLRSSIIPSPSRTPSPSKPRWR